MGSHEILEALYSKGNEICVHWSSIHNSWEMESTSTSVNWWMDNESIVQTHNEILLSCKEKWNREICRSCLPWSLGPGTCQLVLLCYSVKAKDQPFSTPSAQGLQACVTGPSFFHGCWDSHLSTCLCNRHFTSWAMSPAPASFFSF